MPKYWLAAYKSASNLSTISTMKLSISGNTLYADNLKVCFCEAGNERTSIPAGHYPVTIEFSHVHDLELPKADGIGWIGASHGCDIVLGGVIGSSGVIPSRNPLGRLLAMIQAKEDMGSSVTMEVA